MASQKQKVYAGFFIFSAIALLLTAVAVIERKIGQVGQEFVLVFPEDMSVSGLSKGATVKYMGVPVGKVEEILLRTAGEDQIPHAEARLSIDSDFAQHASNPRVRGVLVLQGLSGSLGIDLSIDEDAAGEESLVAAEGSVPRILAVESGLSEILTNTPELLKDIAKLVRTLNGVIDHNKAHFGSTLAGVDLMMTQGAPRMIALLDEAEHLLRSAETRVLKPGGALDRLEAAVESNLGQLTREVSDSAGLVASSASSTLLGIEDPVLRTLQATQIGLAELRTLIVEMHGVLASNRQVFGSMLAEVRDAAEAVERVLLEVESNPSALIRGEPKKDGSAP